MYVHLERRQGPISCTYTGEMCRWCLFAGVYVHLECCQGPISCTYTGEYIYEIVELDASHLTVAITTYDEICTLFFEAV